MISEAHNLFPGRHIACIISIGSGMGRSDDETEHEAMSGQVVRYNVKQGMQDVGLYDCKKLGEVVAHSEQYLKCEEVKKQSRDVVQALLKVCNVVSRRRKHSDQYCLLFRARLVTCMLALQREGSSGKSKAASNDSGEGSARMEVATWKASTYPNFFTVPL